MLIGVRPDSVFAGADFPAKMAILREIGYDFFELPLTRGEIAALTPDAARHWREAATRTGLPILSTSMGHFTGFAALSDGDREAVIADAGRMVALTHALGADTLLLATAEPGTDAAAYAETYRAALLPLAAQAGAAGVALALEHVAPMKPSVLADLLAAINHPAVRLYFDTGNCLQVGESPTAQASICAPVSAQLHLKHGPTTPLGAMPLREVREIFAASGFAGRGCLEILHGGDARERPLWEARGLLKMAGYL